ncbi:MAG: sulfite exporter TauE/SafE family protein [Ignavibacteria bacterium]|jgi:sulfite exporter TauE/SafE
MEYLAALLIGLAGSFHCVGMCGPIALSLSAGSSKDLRFLLKRITYNAGRVLTYASLGFIFGFIGDRLNLFGLQRWLSVFIGSLLILFVIVTYIKWKNPLAGKAYKLISPIFSKTYSSLKEKNSFYSMAVIGMLNGLLPCGFVYIGLGGAIAIGGALEGALYMAMFGLGTVPVMLGVTMFGNLVTARFRTRILKLVPVMVLLLGVLFVLRGLNLGIPYISPHEVTKMTNAGHEVMCR